MGNGARENPIDVAAREAELERLVAKLTKINAALMQRVERSMDQQANAFSLFQTAIALEEQVRLRTEELKAALSRLEEANDELTVANEASERASRFKTRFFTAVGHDLLQPLHAARLSLSALSDQVTFSEHSRIAGQIDHALSSVEELLRSILDISKLEAGVTTPVLRPVELGELFASLVNDLAPVAREKSLVLGCRDTDLGVVSDAHMLRRILQNLAANALRYTEAGRVLLAARRRGEDVRIEVWDTGPGIAEAERARIFEEFQRGAASEEAGRGGFGLGLSIVSRMVQSLGHGLDLCSRTGHGSRFAIIAPYAGAIRGAPQVTAYGSEPADAYGFADATVIVIDNDPAVLAAMQSLLAGWSCRVRAARDLAGIDALLGENDLRPSIVLADYHLDRGERGPEAVRRLRAVFGDLPAVVITADHAAVISEDVRVAGCELLRKPVKPAELRALMHHLMADRPARQPRP